MRNEFLLIETYFTPLTGNNPAALGLKDDAALVTPKPGYQLVITKDIIVEGVHFFAGDHPKTLAQKALRVNLSDLAAKGATPMGYFLGLVLPKNVEESWIAEFAKGLQEDNQEFGIVLLGGDTTAQETGIVVSITALGEVPDGMMLRRSGAMPGDGVYVSGTLGDSALGLRILQENTTSAHTDYLLSRYYLPQPRTGLGLALRGVASAAMDISDGLLQDAGHMAAASGVGIAIDAATLPLSNAAAVMLEQDASLLEIIATGGDDYELLFTAPPAKAAMLASSNTPIARIGHVTDGEGVVLYDRNHVPLRFPKMGYSHF